MGERVGSMLTRSQNLFLIIGVGFLLGFLITISEPDLQVLANQVPSIPNMTLILSVAAGVGIFLVMAFLRMLLGIPLPRLLVIFTLPSSFWLHLCRKSFWPWPSTPAASPPAP